jgi:hypothetical protein
MMKIGEVGLAVVGGHGARDRYICIVLKFIIYIILAK